MIKKIVSGLIILIVIGAAIGTLLLTPIGLRVALYFSQYFIPGKIHYQSASGLITGPIQIKNLQYQNKNITLDIAELHWQWRLSSLLKHRLIINHLTAKHVNLTTRGQQQSMHWSDFKNALQKITATSTQQIQQNLLTFKLPLSIKIDQAVIENFHYRTSANQILHVKQIHLNGLFGTKKSQITLLVKTLDHIISGYINIHFSPNIKWQTHITSQHFNTSLFNSTRPHKIDFRLKSSGHFFKNELVFTVKSSLQTPDITLRVNADHKRSWLVHWRLAIQKLQSLYPDYQGQINSQGSLTGPLTKPLFKGAITAHDIVIKNNRLGKLQANWQIDFGQHSPGRFDIIAKQLYLNHTAIDILKLQGEGQLKNHNIIGELLMPKIAVHWRAHGGLSPQQHWLGEVTQLKIVPINQAAWQLMQPASLNITAQFLQLKKTCLVSNANKGTICVLAHWQAQQPWQLQLSGKHINLQYLSRMLKLDSSLIGMASFKLNAQGIQNIVQRAKWQITLLPGKLRYFIGNKTIYKEYQLGSVQGHLTKHTLKSTFSLDISKDNYLHGTILLPNYSGDLLPKLSQPIEGTLQAELRDMNIVSAFLPSIVIPQGKLSANLKFSGTISEPILQGQAQLSKSRIRIPEYHFELTQMNLKLKAKRKKIYYHATAFSKNSALTLSGFTDLAKPGLLTQLTIAGKNILTIDTDAYQIYATPNLTLKMQGNKIQITGDITIPKGEIKPHDFRNVVTLPTDEITYITAQPATAKTPWQITSHINLHLGKQLKINTYGIKGLIYGNVILIKKPKQTLLANGRIAIKNGIYKGHGQSLIISPASYIQFTNSPISNPALYIRASKKVNVVSTFAAQAFTENKYIVGIFIQGTPSHPKVSLFSIPATLTQADILSYLLTGTAAQVGSSANVSLLSSAVSALQLGGKHVSKVGSMLKKIRQGLGISEFGVETRTKVDALGNPITKQSAFVIGKHLTDRIYLRYSHGINGFGLSNVNEFTLRYRLNRHWLLQSNSSSLGSGLDILYTVEKK